MRLGFVRYVFILLCLVDGNIHFAQISDTLNSVTITKAVLLNPSKGNSLLEFDSLVLQDYNHQELSSLLSNQAGLFVKNSGPNSLATISIRGLSASHTRLFWNNISISSPTLGLSDLSLLPINFFDQVNINMGGSTIIDGSGAMGGSINLTNSASKKLNGHKFGIGLSYNPILDNQSKSLSHAWRKSKFEIQTKAILQNAKNEYPYLDQNTGGNRLRENGSLNRIGFSQNVFFNFNRFTEISFKGMYLKNEKFLSPPIGVTNNFQSQSDVNVRGVVSLTKNKRGWYHGVGLSLTKDDSRYLDPTVFIDSKFKINGIYAYHHLGYEWKKGLIVGTKINLENNAVKSSGFANEISQKRASILGTINYSSESGFGTLFSLRNEMEKGRSDNFSPSLAMYYYPMKSRVVKIKSNINRKVRIPTLNDLYWEEGGNINLRDETSVSGEFGIEYNKGNFSGSVIYYGSNTDDWIQWIPMTNSIWSPINIKKVNAQGVEIAFTNINISANFLKTKVSAQYRYGKTINKESNDINENLWGKDLIFSPRHQFALNVSVSRNQWRLSYNQKITSKVFLDPLNTSYLPYTAPASVTLGMKNPLDEKSSFDFALKCDNVFDEDYQVQANHPMPGRNISVIIGLNF